MYLRAPAQLASSFAGNSMPQSDPRRHNDRIAKVVESWPRKPRQEPLRDNRSVQCSREVRVPPAASYRRFSEAALREHAFKHAGFRYAVTGGQPPGLLSPPPAFQYPRRPAGTRNRGAGGRPAINARKPFVSAVPRPLPSRFRLLPEQRSGVAH
jgi:hypothetical protein